MSSRIYDKDEAEWGEYTIQMNSQLVIEIQPLKHSAEELAEMLMDNMLKHTGLKVVKETSHDYPVQGYTKVDILEASCVIVHTYPEHKAIIMETSLSSSLAWDKYRNWLYDFYVEFTFAEDAPAVFNELLLQIFQITENISAAKVM